MILNVSKIDRIDVKTITSIQNNESIFIIINVVIKKFLNFMRLKNRVTVVHFGSKKGLTRIANVHDIIKLHKSKRFHFEKVVLYVKSFYVEHEFVEQFFLQISTIHI